MENMPWPNTLGCPAFCAATSSWCIGLKSPDAPAYLTRSVRVSVCEITGASSPTCTDSYDSFCSLIASQPLRLASVSLAHAHARTLARSHAHTLAHAHTYARWIRFTREVAT